MTVNRDDRQWELADNRKCQTMENDHSVMTDNGVTADNGK